VVHRSLSWVVCPTRAPSSVRSCRSPGILHLVVTTSINLSSARLFQVTQPAVKDALEISDDAGTARAGTMEA
jgi:hypothetical protein